MCTNGTECIQCKENFLAFAENTICDTCQININYIKNELTENLITTYANEYINKNKNKYSIVDHYVNNDANYTITIFRAWFCTNSLLQNDYFEINSEIITNKLRNNLKNSKHYVIEYVNNKFKNYFQIYDNEQTRKINIKDDCPDCLEGNNLKLTNNFTSEINDNLGEVMKTKIFENNIDIFSKDNPIFSDMCKNFTIENIDIPLK